MNKNSKLWIVLKGIIAENPVLVLVLGTCPALAVSTSIVSAISMGLNASPRHIPPVPAVPNAVHTASNKGISPSNKKTISNAVSAM